jgi:hypothetical protein
MKQMTAVMVAMGVACLMSACSDPTPPVTPTPVPATITEVFTGTLLVAGNNMIPFSVQHVGALKVTLTAVDPPVTVGLGIGTPSTGVCVPFQQAAVAPGGPPALSGTATVSGNFCVSIFDVGNLTTPVSYTITVQHS